MEQGTLDHNFWLYGADDLDEAIEYYKANNLFEIELIDRSTDPRYVGTLLRFRYFNGGEETILVQDYAIERGRMI